LGPSGCGKTTLLRTIAGLSEAASGTIQIAGKDVTRLPPARRGVAMVFQSYALYPHLTVFDNVAFGLRMQHRSRAEIDTIVAAALKLVQLTELANRKPFQLSGGEQQRVAIARAVSRRPKLLLFDEPLSHLDAGLRSAVKLELVRLHKSLNGTFLYVTHDQREAMSLASKIVIMRGGVIEQVGTTDELYDKPVNKFVATFLGQPALTILSGAVASQFNAYEIGIRPEHASISTDRVKVEATLEFVEAGGNLNFAHFRLATGELFVMQLGGGIRLDRGLDAGLWFDETKVFRFDKSGRRLP